jgi:hypothetical protein
MAKTEESAIVLDQFYLGCLSQASYLVADEVSRRAVVVDPRRDVSEYLAAAEVAEARLRLARVGVDAVTGTVTDLEALITSPS